MSQPLVSIIIPCFNAEHWVADAIDSALAQEYRSIEIVVVDDGSTDGTRSVIERYGKSVRSSFVPNAGAAAARNRGVGISRGEYIQFLDADDVLYPSKVERCMAYRVETPDRLIITGYDYQTSPGSTPIPQPFPTGFSNMDSVVMVLRSPIQTSAPLHRRDDLLRITGFDEALPCAQEFDLHLRLACAGVNFRYIPDAMFCVKKRSGSVSGNYLRVLDHAVPLAARAFDKLALADGLSDDRCLAFAGFMTKYGRDYLRWGRKNDGLACFGRARRYHTSAGLNGYGIFYRSLCRAFGPLAAERLAGWKPRPSVAS